MVQFLSLSTFKFPKAVADFLWDIKAFILIILSFPTLRLKASESKLFKFESPTGVISINKDHFGKYIYYVKLQLP